jgi:hypothetical protein
MKLFGYAVGSEEGSPLALEEVSVVADPATLRRMSEFLLFVADLIEKHGDDFGHEHFEDFVGDRHPECRFVLCGKGV